MISKCVKAAPAAVSGLVRRVRRGWRRVAPGAASSPGGAGNAADSATRAMIGRGTAAVRKTWQGWARGAPGAAASVLRRVVAGTASATRAVTGRGALPGWPRIVLGAAACVIPLGGVWALLWLAAPVETPGAAPAPGETVVFTVAPGATFGQITDTLVARGLVRRPLPFGVYARLRRDERNVRAGTYALDAGTGWASLLDALVEGRVRMLAVTIPEGLTLPGIATRIARVTELPADTVRVKLGAKDAHARWNLPGPGLEGFLFPDTYLFAGGVPLDAVIEAMSERYRGYWTPEREARAAELGMSEREVVTLASIIQAEARVSDEMPAISAVYHNRLRVGMLLQADPTVLYALGGHRPRLLFAAIDSVAEHPYNTYSRGGLPPGPIGAPGAAALDAALHPAEADYLYFVANADGSHTFSRTLGEHNRAVARARREVAGAGPGDG